MTVCLRLLSALCLAALLAACNTTSQSTLGELPRTHQGTTQELLQQATAAKTPQDAAQLRLAAANQAMGQNDPSQAGQIMQQVPLDQLQPGEQILASTLNAEVAMAANQPKVALTALTHPSLARLNEATVPQQTRTQLVRARALEADGQVLEAARQRIFIAPLLNGAEGSANHEAIWSLIASLPPDQLQSTGNDDLSGWLSLARAVKSAGTIEQQQAAIDTWRAQNPQHPAALQLPTPLTRLKELASKPLTKIALLLPQEGQLAGVARALREGFLAASFQSQQAGQPVPNIQIYDSSRLTSMDEFYKQAQADGVQLVIGPLEKPLVKQLSERSQLPLPTLALNYSDSHKAGPPQLYQFGLAAEDEAREVARRAWADGKRSAVALVPRGEWGDRVLEAFRNDWEKDGGTLLGAEHVDQPVDLAKQIGELFQLRGTQKGGTPTRRQDVDFVFLAATPQQAQQIKPTLVFQYAGDVPVYATSHLFSASGDTAQYNDLNGVMFCETPWLLNADDPLRQQVSKQWPQAAGSLGRLYAMGIDAYRLAPRLEQLKTLPDSRIDGASGSLSVTADQRVERQLPWAQFVDGKVQRLTDTRSDAASLPAQ